MHMTWIGIGPEGPREFPQVHREYWGERQVDPEEDGDYGLQAFPGGSLEHNQDGLMVQEPSRILRTLDGKGEGHVSQS